MKTIPSILSKLQAIDIFASPISVQYGCKQNYKTRTGSCLSIGLLCFLLFNIYPFFMALIHYENINVTDFISYQQNPTTVTINKYNLFFAIGIFSVDMFSQTSKLFEYELIHYTVRNGVTTKNTIPMVQCDQAVFKSTYASISDIYAKMSLHHYLCLPENTSLNISGKESGDYEYMSFRAKGCSSNCASPADVQMFQQLKLEYYINFFFINKLLNPNKIDPITYYFEDKLFSTMSANLLKKTDIFISEYVIDTQQSLFMPFSNEKLDQGFFININERTQTTLPVTNRTYIEFNLFKSDQKYHIIRSYVTVSDLLSYVGGLFAIYVMLFGCVITQYNKMCFTLNLYRKVFYEEQFEGNHPNSSEKEANSTFNFLTFIKYILSQVVFTFCSPKAWPAMYGIKQKIQETQNKINVDDFVDRIVSFEKRFMCLLHFQEISLLMLQDKNSIADEKNRRNFILRNNEVMSLTTIEQTPQYNKIAPEVHQENRTKIYEAIAELQKMKNLGDQRCRKILQGVSQSIYEKYEKYKGERSNQQNKQDEGSENSIQKYPVLVPRFKKLNEKQKKLFSKIFDA